MTRERFHAVVVGSGFGGSVAACRLAEGGLDVCLLERGRRYPPGSFPRSPVEMRDNFWDPSERLYGLFDAWSFDRFEALVSSGLGGGSLIYANVLIRKDEFWFVHDKPDGSYDLWPVSRDDLEPHYDEVERRLGGTRYPMDHEPYDRTPKTRALREAANRLGLEWDLPNLAVTFAPRPGADPIPGEPIEEGPNLHGRTRQTCRLCGECDVGCNYGSKNTLDFNYLSDAERANAQIRDLCEVRGFEPIEDGYRVRYVKHEPNGSTRSGGLPLHEVDADRLILAAGTLGTSYLLLKNRERFPGLSSALGTRFSGNGDLLGICLGAEDRSTGEPRRLDPEFGPVITSAIRVPDRREGGDGPGYYVEDGGIPAFSEWAIEALDVPGAVRRAIRFGSRWIWQRWSDEPKSRISAELGRAVGEARASSGTLVMLGMGRDTPDGTMDLDDRYLAVDWSKDTSKPFFDRVRRTMRRVADGLAADFRDNPLWYFKRTVTVHPLGGCPMGDSPETGVVDSFGEVYGHPGLHVVDGSVMPGPVGPNPSLTIAAIADRAATRILES